MSTVNEVKEFFMGDTVYSFDKLKKIIFGVVAYTYDDVDDNCELQKGQICVRNNSDKRSLWKQNKVWLMSRSICIGDIVVRRLENGTEAQRGYCKKEMQFATVQIVGTDKIIERVPRERLNAVSLLDDGFYVCLDNKFGIIFEINQKIKMQSKCGSTVEISSRFNIEVKDVWLNKRKRNYYGMFYPGQEVICTPNKLTQPQWLHLSEAMKRSMHTHQRFTVQKVEPLDIKVSWFNSVFRDIQTDDIPRLFSDIQTDDIPRLKILEPVILSHLVLDERRLLKLNFSNVLLTKKNWIRKQSVLYQPKRHKVLHIVNRTFTKDRGPKLRCPLLLATYVKIADESEEDWYTEEEEEEVSNNASSSSTTSNWIRKQSVLYQPKRHKVGNRLTSLVHRGPKLGCPLLLATYVKIADESEEDWYTEEEEEEVSNNASSSSTTSNTRLNAKHFPPKLRELEPGNTVAVEVLYTDSKVTIVWQDGTEEKDISTTLLHHIRFSLELDNYEFFPGEWVISDGRTEKYGAVQHANHLERVATVKWFTHNEGNGKPQLVSTNEMSVYDLRKHPKYKFRPGSVVTQIPIENEKFGTVLDSYPEGYVIVQWINGVQESCWPQNLALIQMSGETESIESHAGDLLDEAVAARLDFVRGRVTYLKDVLKQHNSNECFLILEELLMIYDNCSYLDKLLDTSFFSLKSRYFQVLLSLIKEKAKMDGVELRGRLFSSVENLDCALTRSKNPETENISKVLQLQNKFTHIGENGKDVNKEEGEPSVVTTPDSECAPIADNDICVELLSVMKVRMDLAYAEIISRIGGPEALTVMPKASDALPVYSTSLPSLHATPEDSSCLLNQLQLNQSVISSENEVFTILDEAHFSHHFYFYNSKFRPTDKQKFVETVQKEFELLKESLAPGVWVRSYRNRMDLLSVMIEGPKNTPYEDGLFLFDLQLSQDYPVSPPLCHYISYSSESLNPNLYVDGTVCISLLGIYPGTGEWSTNSTLLQLIVSIQGLISVAEPYYIKDDFEKERNSQQGYENSRNYNELVVLKVVQSMKGLAVAPPEVFSDEIGEYCATHGEKMCNRLERWCDVSDPLKPEFPLLISKGFKLSVMFALKLFKDVLNKTNSASNAQSVPL